MRGFESCWPILPRRLIYPPTVATISVIIRSELAVEAQREQKSTTKIFVRAGIGTHDLSSERTHTHMHIYIYLHIIISAQGVSASENTDINAFCLLITDIIFAHIKAKQ